MTWNRANVEESFRHIVEVCNKHNSLYLTLTFNRNYKDRLAVEQIIHLYHCFMVEVVRLSGMKASSVAHVGIFLSNNHEGKRIPHIHAIIYSSKSRRTGRTIAQIGKEKKEKLAQLWESIPHSNDLKFEEIFCAQGVLDYLTGYRNIKARYQEWFELPQFNASLVKRKASNKQLDL